MVTMDQALEKKTSDFRTLSGVLAFLFIFSLPFENIISANGHTITLVLGILLALNLLLTAFVDHQKPRISVFLVLLLLYFLFAIVSIFYSFDKGFSITMLLPSLGNFALLAVFLCFCQDGPLFKRWGLIASSSSSFLAALILFFSPTIQGGGNHRRTITLLNSYIDPNYLAALLVVGCLSSALLFIGFFRQAGKRLSFPSLFCLLVFLVSSFGVVLTESRIVLLLLLILIAGVLVAYFRLIKGNSRNVLWSIILCAFAFLAVFLAFYFLGYFKRFSWDGIVYDFSNGRGDIWSSIFSIASAKPFLGWGFGSFIKVATAFADSSSAAHSVFVQTYIELGICGLIPLAGFFFALFFRGFKSKSWVELFLGLFVLVFCSLYDPWTAKCFWLLLLFEAFFPSSDVHKERNLFCW
jgi:O-antigen ligase